MSNSTFSLALLHTHIFSFSTFFFVFSQATHPHFPSVEQHSISGWWERGESSINYNGDGTGMVVSVGTTATSKERVLLAEGSNSGESIHTNNLNSSSEGPNSADLTQINFFSSSSLVLAPKRTRRKDPLDGFKLYTGGWNLTDHHYWASVGYTAVPFYVIAAVWFLLFGFCLLIICCCRVCCARETYGYSRVAYALSLILLILFTIASIIGCFILYTGQRKFHTSTTRTLDYAISQADDTVWKLRNVSDYLSAAKQIGVDNVYLPSNVQTDIDEIEAKINSSASMLSDKVLDNAGNIQDVLDSVRIAIIIIAAVMLFLTFLGFLFSIFGMQVLVYTLVIFGWILVTGTFILCGVFLLLHNVAADTCVAMHQWVEMENPTSHTAIDDILPCVDNATSQETLLRSKEVTSQLVDLVNQVITNVSNINFSPNFKPLYYNQSGPLLPLLCNPFHHDLTDRSCSLGEVDLTNATQVWQSYVCQASSDGICTTTGRLTPNLYSQMSSAVSVSYGLYNYSPFLIELENCSFVRRTFSDVSREYCPGLRRYSRWVYGGLVMVSGAVMLSLVFWVIYGRERKHRLYIKHGLEGQPKAS